MSGAPAVSIVLPTHNGSRFLEQSIRSCREQTFEDWELIVVDDASDDETPGIIRRFEDLDRRVRRVRNEEIRMLPGSLNIGFARARGELLTWTSDDNLFRPPALERLVGFLRDHPDADGVYADYTIIDEGGRDLRKFEVREPEHLVEENCIGACFLYRRPVQEALSGYREDLFCAEDYDFWLRSAARFRLHPLHEDLYLYRVHGGSLTERRSLQVERNAIASLEEVLPSLGFLGPAMRARGYGRIARSYYRRREYGRIRGALLRAWMASPLETVRLVSDGMVAGFFLGWRNVERLRALRERIRG